MAQLALMAAQLVCNLPASGIVGPVIASAIPLSPLNWALFAAWFFYLKLTKASWAQKFKPNTKTLLKIIAMFYFITAIPIYAVLVWIACQGCECSIITLNAFVSAYIYLLVAG